jgi:N-acetyl-gamma-glutamyl-phosphate reductase
MATVASHPAARTSDASTPLARVAIAGATGYAGQELVRILARHPAVQLTDAMSSGATSAPRPLPALKRIWDGAVTPLDTDRLASAAEIVFLALPEAAAAEVGSVLLARGTRVIDLSGAFRLRGDAERKRWYPATAELPSGVVYGLPERSADAIRGARLVSCPGCYPTAALLALQPLADAGLIEGAIVIDAKSGISGAGKTPSDRTHFSENHGSVAAYGVFSHRHAAEMEQELRTPVTFVPHLVPLDRGILETIYVSVRRGIQETQVAAAMQAAYASSAFVRVTGTELPEIKHVAYTNFCDIGWRIDGERGRLVLVSVLDNLLKGAAGQAVQNLNIVLGLDERTGLL